MTPFEKIIAIRDIENLPHAQKIILLIIATHLGENDFSFLSLETLQKKCGLAKPNLTSNINKLISHGYLDRLHPSDGYKSNRYFINFSTVCQLRSIASNGALPVTERNPSSNGALPHQSRSVTPPVTERYPKRNIKEIKRNIKEERAQKARSSPSPSFYDQNKIKSKSKPFNAREAIMRDYEEMKKRGPSNSEDVQLTREQLQEHMERIQQAYMKKWEEG